MLKELPTPGCHYICDRVHNTQSFCSMTKPECSFLHFKSTTKLCQSSHKFDIPIKIRALITMLGFFTHQLLWQEPSQTLT